MVYARSMVYELEISKEGSVPMGNQWRMLHWGDLFLNFIYFIYLLLAVLGLCCCAQAFSSCGERGLFHTDHEASSSNRRVAGDYLSDVLVSLSYPREPWFSSSIYIHTHTHTHTHTHSHGLRGS